MVTTTIRISPEAHRILKLASEKKGISLVEALDEITKVWEREHFFEQMNEAYVVVREHAEEWNNEQAERDLWSTTLTDNLGNEDGQAET